MPVIFTQYFGAGLGIWVLLFVSDYTLTLACARLYQRVVRDKIAFEGSYEITPYFQRDIDSLRVVSPRFLWALALNSAILFIVWLVMPPSMSPLYIFLLGGLILTQLSVHIRHIRNLTLFRAAAGDGLRGRIEYARPLVLRASAVEMLSFSGMFLMLFAFTQSWFILGGCVGCLGIAWKHWRLARRHVSAPAGGVVESTPSSTP